MNKRYITKLNHNISKEVLDEIKNTSPTDTIGSYAENRYGPLRGAPSITWISTNSDIVNMTVVENISAKMYVQGYNMFTLSNIILSGSNADMFTTPVLSYNYYTEKYNNRLADENPDFKGVAIPAWNLISNNVINFDLPKFAQPGTVDIILQGPAGYCKSSTTQNINIKTLTVTTTTTGSETTGTTGTTATTGSETTGTTGTTATTGSETTAITAEP